MNPYNLDISGDWYTDPAVLEKFSRDMSAYRILPALVVAPKNEEDVLRTLRFAHNEGLDIVSRSGGSDLSGASIGSGIILNFKKYFKYLEDLKTESLKGLRFGANKSLLRDSIYRLTIDKLKALGSIIIEFEPERIIFDGFSSVLRADMNVDLPNYLNEYASDDLKFLNVSDIVNYNKEDTLLRIPYGQARFEAILTEDISQEDLIQLKAKLHEEGIRYFETPMIKHQLDAILSLNNRNAGYAAAAMYPCLTIPLGYSTSGQPAGLTFICRPFEEDKLLKIGYAFEQATRMRKLPEEYK